MAAPTSSSAPGQIKLFGNNGLGRKGQFLGIEEERAGPGNIP